MTVARDGWRRYGSRIDQESGSGRGRTHSSQWLKPPGRTSHGGLPEEFLPLGCFTPTLARVLTGQQAVGRVHQPVFANAGTRVVHRFKQMIVAGGTR